MAMSAAPRLSILRTMSRNAEVGISPRRNDPREDVGFEPLQHVVGVALVTIGFPVRVPLARDVLEGLARRLSLGARIDTVRQEASRLHMALAGPGEPHIRIDPEGERLLFARVTVVIAPVTAAVGGDEEVQTAPIAELAGTFGAFCAPNGGIGEHLWVPEGPSDPIPPNVPAREGDSKPPGEMP